MGFTTTIIIICALAFFSHHWYHKYGLSKGHVAWISYFTLFVVGGFLILDSLIYIGVFDFVFHYLTTQLPWVNIENGKDFMWNSFQLLGIDLGIDFNDPTLEHIAIILLLSYPMWYVFWKDGSRMFFGGNKPFQQGFWYMFSPTKKPKKDEKVAKTPVET